MSQIVNEQAAEGSSPPKDTSAPSDVGTVQEKYKIPLVFMRESEYFGTRKPEKSEWIQHIELYRAIGQKINVTHITGLQRVRGLWRIYLDNLEDKVTLMAEGIPLRGKTIQVLSTNPDRFDGEETVRVRIKNIPLSVDDGLIKRNLTLKEVEVISMYREKLRVDNKLTNCETGDRVVIVKASTLKEPLPISMAFGQFKGRVLHPGQEKHVNSEQLKCSKCLQNGHTFKNCSNDWVCTICNKSGHKRFDCKLDTLNPDDSSASESETSESETEASQDESVKKTTKAEPTRAKAKPKHSKSHKPRKQHSDDKQMSMTDYVTPNKGRSRSVQNRSPPTPVEVLHDKQLSNTNRKKQKQ